MTAEHSFVTVWRSNGKMQSFVIGTLTCFYEGLAIATVANE
jgi:hypothetical protein